MRAGQHFLFFVAMAVIEGIEHFLTQENLLINSFFRKIQYDPEGNLRDEFRLVKSVGECPVPGRISQSKLLEALKIINAKSDRPHRCSV